MHISSHISCPLSLWQNGLLEKGPHKVRREWNMEQDDVRIAVLDDPIVGLMLGHWVLLDIWGPGVWQLF